MISKRSKRAGIKELEIFDNFKIDWSLPKYINGGGELNNITINDPITSNSVITIGSSNTGTTLTNPNNIWVNSEPEEDWGDDGSFSNVELKQRLKFLLFPKKMLNKLLSNKRKGNNLMRIRDYFINFSKNVKELTPLADIAEYYEKAILQADKLGQKSLVEKLKDMLEVVRCEAHLIQMNLKKYVTNEQVCDFYESVDEDKNLKLTWIEHFVKIIPNDIVELKNDIDMRKIFDNYVILHYDPQGTATSLTKEEIEVKKDPILFGVIKNSKRLYYVGDWKDDYCDLTLEGMFEELGEKVLEINNRNLKTFIDKVGDYEQKRKSLKKDK